MKTIENKVGHTPGPWSVKQTAVYKTIVDSEDRLLAFQSIGQPEEFNANARLIASAPELLEACQMMLEKFTDAQCIKSLSWTAARDKARAAIFKAEGAK